MTLMLFILNKGYLNQGYAQEIQHTFSNTIHLPFVELAPGTFEMGDTGKSTGEPAEYPVTEVHVNSFALSVFEVTQIQFETIMEYNPSYNKGAHKPVEQVSWYDAVRFCNRLSLLDGLVPAYRTDSVEGYILTPGSKGYRLPTEAEWEYAARAGTTTDTYAGDLKTHEGRDSVLDRIAWYFIDPATRYTKDVGQKEANQYGFKDILGNVWEWTDSWYNSYDTPSQEQQLKVLRGGAMDAYAYANRSSYRYRLHPSYTSYNIGFRIARTIEETG